MFVSLSFELPALRALPHFMKCSSLLLLGLLWTGGRMSIDPSGRAGEGVNRKEVSENQGWF